MAAITGACAPAANAGVVFVDTVQMRNWHSGLCINDEGPYFTVRQVACIAIPTQWWERDYSGTLRAYRFVNLFSNHCLEQRGETSNGGEVASVPCGGEGNHAQWWSHIATYRGAEQLKNWHTGKCMTVSAASQSEGASIVQYPCNGTWDHSQLWALGPA